MTRLEIAARIMAGLASRPSHTSVDMTDAKHALECADALIAAERETRPKACNLDHAAMIPGGECPFCNEVVKP